MIKKVLSVSLGHWESTPSSSFGSPQCFKCWNRHFFEGFNHRAQRYQIRFISFLHKFVFSEHFQKVYSSFQSLTCLGFCFMEIIFMKVERKVKREASSKFSPWDDINYKDQTKEYFKTIRKFYNQGLNLRSNIHTSIVSNVDITEVLDQHLTYSKLPTHIFTMTRRKN